MGIRSSSPKHNTHIPFPVSFLIPFIFYTPACNRAIQILSLLVQYSIYVLSPHLKFMPRCNADELF